MRRTNLLTSVVIVILCDERRTGDLDGDPWQHSTRNIFDDSRDPARLRLLSRRGHRNQR